MNQVCESCGCPGTRKTVLRDLWLNVQAPQAKFSRKHRDTSLLIVYTNASPQTRTVLCVVNFARQATKQLIAICYRLSAVNSIHSGPPWPCTFDIAMTFRNAILVKTASDIFLLITAFPCRQLLQCWYDGQTPNISLVRLTSKFYLVADECKQNAVAWPFNEKYAKRQCIALSDAHQQTRWAVQ